MGFMDKAKKMAEQAQAKLDEAQKQFNTGQQQDQPSGPAVEYDTHGRPIPQAEQDAPSPPHGDPVASSEPPPAPAAQVPPAQASAQPGDDKPDDDPNHPSYEPPKLTGGDPLAG